jgi:hypothetical protein
MKKLILFFSFIFLLTVCKKKPAPVSQNQDNTPQTSSLKVKLTSDRTAFRVGQEAVITASVEGNAPGNINYEWSVNTSALLMGSGTTVTITACCSTVTGDNIVTCKVTDASGIKGTGQITITINP